MFSASDTESFAAFGSCPDAKKHPHAYRWYIHIAALQGVRGLSAPAAAAPAKAAPAAKKAAPAKKADKKKAKKEDSDDEDFDVFGDDSDEDDEPKESRAEMIARLKKEAEERTKIKEAKQRTLVGLEVKPWSTDQDLKELFDRIITTVNDEKAPVKWGEICHQVEVAYGIKKLVMSFVMGATSSSDDIVEKLEAMEDDIQSVEVTSMNVL